MDGINGHITIILQNKEYIAGPESINVSQTIVSATFA